VGRPAAGQETSELTTHYPRSIRETSMPSWTPRTYPALRRCGLSQGVSCGGARWSTGGSVPSGSLTTSAFMPCGPLSSGKYGSRAVPPQTPVAEQVSVSAWGH
jgi:hypothetical protein